MKEFSSYVSPIFKMESRMSRAASDTAMDGESVRYITTQIALMYAMDSLIAGCAAKIGEIIPLKGFGMGDEMPRLRYEQGVLALTCCGRTIYGSEVVELLNGKGYIESSDFADKWDESKDTRRRFLKELGVKPRFDDFVGEDAERRYDVPEGEVKDAD